MKPALGPRPAAIRLSCTLALCGAVLSYVDGLRHLDSQVTLLEILGPGWGWNHDSIIVALSARLSIVCIPVALVWFLASKVARVLVTLTAGAKLLQVPAAVALVWMGKSVSPLWATGLTFGLAGVVLLYTRPGREWFTRERCDVATFD